MSFKEVPDYPRIPSTGRATGLTKALLSGKTVFIPKPAVSSNRMKTYIQKRYGKKLHRRVGVEDGIKGHYMWMEDE